MFGKRTYWQTFDGRPSSPKKAQKMLQKSEKNRPKGQKSQFGQKNLHNANAYFRSVFIAKSAICKAYKAIFIDFKLIMQYNYVKQTVNKRQGDDYYEYDI